MRPENWFLKVVEETTNRVEHWPEWKSLSDIELDAKDQEPTEERGRGVSQVKQPRSA
jgi:hypothetical protein